MPWNNATRGTCAITAGGPQETDWDQSGWSQKLESNSTRLPSPWQPRASQTINKWNFLWGRSVQTWKSLYQLKLKKERGGGRVCLRHFFLFSQRGATNCQTCRVKSSFLILRAFGIFRIAPLFACLLCTRGKLTIVPTQHRPSGAGLWRWCQGRGRALRLSPYLQEPRNYICCNSTWSYAS